MTRLRGRLPDARLAAAGQFLLIVVGVYLGLRARLDADLRR